MALLGRALGEIAVKKEIDEAELAGMSMSILGGSFASLDAPLRRLSKMAQSSTRMRRANETVPPTARMGRVSFANRRQSPATRSRSSRAPGTVVHDLLPPIAVEVTPSDVVGQTSHADLLCKGDSGKA